MRIQLQRLVFVRKTSLALSSDGLELIAEQHYRIQILIKDNLIFQKLDVET